MPQFKFRVATSEEAAWYTGKLYPLQDRIFRVAATYGNSLVLTGGTALARIFLQHRFSDDIDLFTLEPHAGRLGRDFANALVAAGFDVTPVQASTDFFRAMVSDGNTRIQLDVAPDSPRVTSPLPSEFGVYIHDLRDIAANKISAYENRVEVKDAIDLFYLLKATSWNQMFADAERKRVPIAYEDLQHFLNLPLSGEALLTQALRLDEFEGFVRTLRDEIEGEIKKKVSAASQTIAELTSSLLWDSPPEDRNINERTHAVLARRAKQLPLPQRIALLGAIGSTD